MTKKNENYRLTPYGLLSTVVEAKTAQRCINAIELHLRRHYGPCGALVVDTERGCMSFERLERKE